MSIIDLIIAGLAAIAAGMVNAIAGGGTLITFPVLTALGVPAIAANVTNTVSLCPGYLGGSWAQSKDLKGQKTRILLLVPAAILGGIAGGILLLVTGERLFRSLVPWLILFASILLAIQEPLRKKLIKKQPSAKSVSGIAGSTIAIVPAAVYGGYFGAGLGVILIATLGLLHEDSLIRLNALKQLLSLSVNVAAAFFFVFSGHVYWLVAAIMAVCALFGGMAGGKLAGKFSPVVLRWVIVTIGVTVAVIYFISD
jgi:uncharacterized membrane protein YfcA